MKMSSEASFAIEYNFGGRVGTSYPIHSCQLEPQASSNTLQTGRK